MLHLTGKLIATKEQTSKTTRRVTHKVKMQDYCPTSFSLFLLGVAGKT